MVKFRSFLFVLGFFFYFIFFFFPNLSLSFSAPPFVLSFLFLSSSFSSFSLQCFAFLNSLIKFLHLSMHMVADRSNHFSLISNEICSHKGLFDFSLDPRLSSFVLDHFLVLVTAIAIVENHLLVLVVRVGVSMRVRLRSVVRWQDTATGAITWVSKLI